MPEIIIISAVAENNVIGDKGNIPWQISEDLQHFKELTSGNSCIMGRKTYESLKRKPLPGRENIVISSNVNYKPAGAIIKHSFEEAIKYCSGKDKVFICGGAAVYKLGLKIADVLELTRIHKSYSGDTFFPELDLSEWMKIKEENRACFSFQTYKRKNKDK